MFPSPRVASDQQKEACPKCPNCGSEVSYRYGKTHSGRSRFLCLVCNKQFSLGRKFVMNSEERPLCPVCGKRMHVYSREEAAIRFRCMDYPTCRTFVKVEKGGYSG
jgi:transposase-like protein